MDFLDYLKKDTYFLTDYSLLENFLPRIKECLMRLMKFKLKWVDIRDEHMRKRLENLEDELEKTKKEKSSESSSSDDFEYDEEEEEEVSIQ